MSSQGWKSQGLVYDNRVCIAETSNSSLYSANMRTVGSRFKKKVVLKVLKKENLSKDYMNQLVPVVEFESPYCSSIFQFDIYKSRPMVVMEFIDGMTLSEIYRRGGLSESECNEVYQQCLLGLMDLKRGGLFHGDLSPSNIMVDKFGRVKLIDFGLGHLIFTEPQATLEFASEKVLSGQVPDFETDVESLKILFQTMFNAQIRWCENNLEPVCDFNVQKRLGQKVRQLLAQEAASCAKTARLELNATFAAKFRSWPMALCILLSLILGSVSPAGQKKVATPAFLSVSTQDWIELSLDKGTPLGYTPLNGVPLSEGTHTIHWKSYNSEGQVTLTLKSGEHRVLGDHFFK